MLTTVLGATLLDDLIEGHVDSVGAIGHGVRGGGKGPGAEVQQYRER